MARNSRPVLTLRGSRATVTGTLPGELAILDVAGGVIGEMAVRVEGAGATVDSVTIEPGRRGFGYGGESVRLVEAWAVTQGVTRFHASVDEKNGLGVYFLLRLGYSPSGLSIGADGRASLEMMRTPG